MIQWLIVMYCIVSSFDQLALRQPPATAPSTAPSLVSSAPKQSRSPHPKPVPGVINEMTTTELGNFDFDQQKGSAIPKDVAALDGSTIRLRGYMIPMDQSSKIQSFALVPYLFYGPDRAPMIQQVVVVTLPEGKPTSERLDQIAVTGTLHVRVKTEDGFLISVFDMDGTSVQPVNSISPSSQPN